MIPARATLTRGAVEQPWAAPGVSEPTRLDAVAGLAEPEVLKLVLGALLRQPIEHCELYTLTINGVSQRVLLPRPPARLSG